MLFLRTQFLCGTILVHILSTNVEKQKFKKFHIIYFLSRLAIVPRRYFSVLRFSFFFIYVPYIFCILYINEEINVDRTDYIYNVTKNSQCIFNRFEIKCDSCIYNELRKYKYFYLLPQKMSVFIA